MEIKIACDTKLYLPLENILDFQGELKSLSTTNYERLKKQILEQGFSAPIFVWKNDAKYYCLDGTQRRLVLNKLKSEGYKIPDLPCVEIFAKTKREAKKKLLSYVSQFGKVEGQGLYQYIIDAELGIEDMEEFEIPELDMEVFKEEFFDNEEENRQDEPIPLDENEILVTVSFLNEFDAENFYNVTKEAGHKCKLIV